MLEDAGTWISGELISQNLGISRAAVGKHITGLRNDGHAIEAVTRKGYKLRVKCDVLDEKSVTMSLATHVFGKAGWTFLETTTSTNLHAAHLAGQGAREGHVVVAEKQTRGRGRKGYGWISVPRSLQFSVLLYPQASFWDVETFTRLGAQAVADAVKELTKLDAVFKIPNDVLLGGKKIAGILVETGYRGNEPEWAVIGVGCNVNMVPEDLPEAVRGDITSIFMKSGHPISRNMLISAILEKLETAYEEMRKNKV